MASRMMRSRSWRKGKHFINLLGQMGIRTSISEKKNCIHSQQTYPIRNIGREYCIK